jgi:hypothetical protein
MDWKGNELERVQAGSLREEKNSIIRASQ